MKNKTLLYAVIILIVLNFTYLFRSDLLRLYEIYFAGFPQVEKLSMDLLKVVEDNHLLPPPLRSDKDAENSFLTKEGVFKFANTERTNAGETALTGSAKLDQAAMIKAQDMFNRQYFAHESPTGEGVGSLAEKTEYEYLILGENLAQGNFIDDADLVKAWMDSPGHRENILSPKFREIGIAVLEGTFEGEKTWIAVQEFGTPLSVCPQTDPDLKTAIEKHQQEIEDLNAGIAAKKGELDRMSKRDREAYNNEVREYNQMVNDYNDSVADLKAEVQKYNAQVRGFNECIQEE